MIDMKQLPPPLRGIEKGSFTEFTMSKRLPDIALRTAQEGDWRPAVRQRLVALAEDMPQGFIRPLQVDAPDGQRWSEWMAPYMGQTWLEAPWFPAEVYFFRRILEATGYFRPGEDQEVDPYRRQKMDGLSGLAEQLEPVCASLQEGKAGARSEMIMKLLHTVIWGNQADLSIWPAGSETPANHGEDERAAHILADQAPEAADFLLQKPEGLNRIDFILDNVGLELAYDLLLADFLFQQGLAQTVRFHAKPYPTYVSDATIPDVQEQVVRLAQAQQKNAAALGSRLQGYLADGRLKLQAEEYWVSPFAGWEMPGDLHKDLGRAGLVISKGDANYRRWLGDRHWSFTRPLSEIIDYFPAPLLLIRVLKSEMVAGLDEALAQTAERQDPKWMYDGNWGVIQFLK